MNWYVYLKLDGSLDAAECLEDIPDDCIFLGNPYFKNKGSAIKFAELYYMNGRN